MDDDYEESEDEYSDAEADYYEEFEDSESESGDVKDEDDYDDSKGSKKRKSITSKKKLPPKKRANTKTQSKTSSAAISQLGFKSKTFQQQKIKNKKRAHKNLKQILTIENYQDLSPTIPTCKHNLFYVLIRSRYQYRGTTIYVSTQEIL